MATAESNDTLPSASLELDVSQPAPLEPDSVSSYLESTPRQTNHLLTPSRASTPGLTSTMVTLLLRV
jgi:hypothetical protein